MAETATLKLVSPDASSVLIPLHSHFATLASSVEQAVTDRFQYKILAYETTAARDLVYTESTGLPVDSTSSKPPLVDGDVCYIRQNKRYYIWNVNTTGTNSWTATLKRFTFSTVATRDVYLAEDITEGDTCYVTDIDIDFVWDGSAWQTPSTSVVRAIPTGQFYPPAVYGTSNQASIVGRILYIPFHVPTKGTYDAYNYNVVTGAASSVITIGLFNSSSTTGLPTTLITGTTAQGATTGTGVAVTATFTATVLQPGWYWIASWCNGTPTLVTTGNDTARGGNWYMPKGPAATYSINMNFAEIRDNTNTGSAVGSITSPAGTITYGETQRAPYISIRKSA
jgi:hypothetical protein